jgi:hypothetical protein
MKKRTRFILYPLSLIIGYLLTALSKGICFWHKYFLIKPECGLPLPHTTNKYLFIGSYQQINMPLLILDTLILAVLVFFLLRFIFKFLSRIKIKSKLLRNLFRGVIFLILGTISMIITARGIRIVGEFHNISWLGVDGVGFPFSFVTQTGESCMAMGCYPKFKFLPVFFVIDVLIFSLILYIIWQITRKLK